MSELKQAAAFRDMLLEATTVFMAPHIEGVFEAFKGNYKLQDEWISVDDEDPNPSSYHHVLDASGSVRICLVIDYKSFGIKDNCWQDLDLNDVDMKGTMFIEIATPTPPKEI